VFGEMKKGGGGGGGRGFAAERQKEVIDKLEKSGERVRKQ